jgi:hypothetical protein
VQPAAGKLHLIATSKGGATTGALRRAAPATESLAWISHHAGTLLGGLPEGRGFSPAEIAAPALCSSRDPRSLQLVATVRVLLTVGFWGFRCKEPTVNSHDELTVATRYPAGAFGREKPQTFRTGLRYLASVADRHRIPRNSLRLLIYPLA